MKELRTVYIIGNKDATENFIQAEKALTQRGYQPRNPVRIRQEYERRFGSLSQEEWRAKLLGHLLRADGVMLLSGWTSSAEAAIEQEVSAFCGKATVKILLTERELTDA